MTPAPDASPLEHETTQHLTLLLRSASNRLEMLMSPDQVHHEDDAERRRIQRLDAAERSALQHDVMQTIRDVRAEFRRRAGQFVRRSDL